MWFLNRHDGGGAPLSVFLVAGIGGGGVGYRRSCLVLLMVLYGMVHRGGMVPPGSLHLLGLFFIAAVRSHREFCVG